MAGEGVIAWNAVRVTRASLGMQPDRSPNVTRRLFLVAGSAGSGKSTLAKALAHELAAGWLQLDSIWLAMKIAAGEGTPARDVLDIDRRMRLEDEADGDVLAAHVAASGEVCRALPTVLGLEFEAHERLVVDGAWLLPSFVTELELPDTAVRAVYVVQRTEADVEAALIARRGGLPLEDPPSGDEPADLPVRRLAGQRGARTRPADRRGATVRVPAGSRTGCAPLALKGPIQTVIRSGPRRGRSAPGRARYRHPRYPTTLSEARGRAPTRSLVADPGRALR